MNDALSMATYDVACTTPDCENENIVIRVPATSTNPDIVCGGCNTQITNVTKIEEGVENV